MLPDASFSIYGTPHCATSMTQSTGSEHSSYKPELGWRDFDDAKYEWVGSCTRYIMYM